MTVGGKSGPRTRDDLCDTAKAFLLIYGVAATAMTLTEDGVVLIGGWAESNRVDSDELLRRLQNGESVQFFGMKCTMGLEYSFSI